jgi:hypothetical protein
MSTKNYIPRPVFDTFAEVIEQYKAIYASDNPQLFIRQWLSHCLASTVVTAPIYAAKDYQCALNLVLLFLAWKIKHKQLPVVSQIIDNH